MLGQPAPPPQQPRGSTTDTELNPRDDESIVDVSADPPVRVAPEMLQRNRLLAALPAEERLRLGSELRLVELGIREQIYDPGEAIAEIYFPVNCVISVVAAVEDDVAVEVAMVGLEGMAGLPAFLGAAASPHRCFCQVPGQALRLDTVTLRRFLAGDGALHDLLHRYTQAVMVFLAQNIACNRLHSTEERTARWLAQTDDRVGSDSFQITQDFLAQMLGVRRATVSESARTLHQAGLIRYSRGRITVVDRDGLQAAACQCYLTIRHEFDKLR
jgi:CRP-like cAMP-binding protein